MEIFRTYDIRGKVPADLNEEIAYNIGRSLVLFLKTRQIIVGRDCRTSSPALMQAFVNGITDQGCDVVDIGLCSTPVLYFASRDGPAAMVTASHMTKEFNGLKFRLVRTQVFWILKRFALQVLFLSLEGRGS